MAERITVELVRANRGERALVEAGGDDIDSAMAAFDAAVAGLSERELSARCFVRARLNLDEGDVTIAGADQDDYQSARETFDSAKMQYSSGPGWGGPG